ncbi:hypothetical protein F511_07851 [Dorcoceras hygrometricum]|uniref:Uncharacterized protein n=1 Tax=Dorcoceras hygrometricum TaxID=472368 RepID=A0A2Z7B1A2_9LAMI|nr:hypothetical protein F511_07851 [Dorcoceras hygrometricum]
MLATGFIALRLACDCAPADLYRSSSILRLFLASVPAGPFAPADLSSSAEHDVVTNDIIIDGPLRCSSWFSFDVPADPSSSSSACSWFILVPDDSLCSSLVHYLLNMMSSPMTSSSMVHLDVPAGSLLMYQLIHLPLLALAAGSYRSR